MRKTVDLSKYRKDPILRAGVISSPRSGTVPSPRADEAFLPPSEYSLRGAAGLVLLLHAILSILFQIGWVSMPEGLFGISKSGMAGYVIAAIIMQGICILFPTLYVIFRFRIPPDTVLGISGSTPVRLFMAVIIGIPAAFVFTGLNNGFIYLLSRMDIILPSSKLPELTVYQGPVSFALILMVSVLLPGIIEELMFRGVIQGSMEREGGRISVIIFQAFAFSVFHADPLFILSPFLAGLLLGYLRQKTGSIFPGILAHISLNLTMMVMQPLLPRITSDYFTMTASLQTLYSSLLAACVAAVALIPMLLIFSSLPGKQKNSGSKRVIFPFEWKFILGCLVLISALLFSYFADS
ncbi:MAG: CPBP family intramembrane glutamic endopeptidase [Saccharofermentanales bacterium]